jgi:uncharacterized membrane protein YeiB
MKALVILGAVIGFLIGSGFGLASQSPWPTALWRACAVALMAAVLTRWWSRIWMQGLREALEQRRAARPAPSIVEKPKR